MKNYAAVSIKKKILWVMELFSIKYGNLTELPVVYTKSGCDSQL